MLLPRKIGNSNAQKVLPTINIVKKESLKGWSLLRKSIMEYGRSYNNRVECLIAVLSTYAVISTCLIVLTYFKVITLDPVLVIEFGFDSLQLIIMLFLLLIWGASLNETFREQIKNIHTNKLFIQDLLLVEKTYTQGGKASNNFLFNKSLQIIQQNLCDDQTVEEYLKDLLEYYDQLINELEYDEQNHPYTLFGVKITKLMLKSLFVAIGSLAATVLFDYINKQFNAIDKISKSTN